jgi:chemotaxis protein MotB
MVDLKTLLLTLFVVLVAYASFEPDRYTGAPVPGMEGKAKESSPISESTVTEIPSESPSSASEKGQGAITPSAQGEISQSPLPLPTQPESSSLPSPSPVLTPATGVPPLPAPPEPPSGPSEAELALKRKLEAMGDQVSVTMTKGQINLQIRDNILFPPGAARLSDEGAALLQGIARTLDEDDYRISIEGHTDSTPIQNVRFASNWELSSGRATAVLRYLIAQGITPARLRAVGYADTRPVADNATAEGRAANRRVNLVLHLQTGENS